MKPTCATLFAFASAGLAACTAPGLSDKGQFNLLIAGTADQQLSALAAGFEVPLTVQQLQDTDIDLVAALGSSDPTVLDPEGAAPQLPMRSNGDRQTFTVHARHSGTVRLTLLDEAGAEIDAFTVEVREPAAVELHDSGDVVNTRVLMRPGSSKLVEAQLFDDQHHKLVTGDLQSNFSWASMDQGVVALEQAERCTDCRPGYPLPPQQRVVASDEGLTQVVFLAGNGLRATLDVEVSRR